MIDKILILCPSRGRPQGVRELVETWRNTKSGLSDFLLLLDADDEKLGEYLDDYLIINDIIISVNERKGEYRGAVRMFDKGLQLFPNYKYYMIMGDDCRFRTRNWDRLMVEKIEKEGGWGIVYGNDLHQGESLASLPVISANLIKITGYIAPPSLNHLYIDMVWTKIGREMGKLFYMPEIVIEHLHPDAGKAEMDETYREVIYGGRAEQDTENYKIWLEKEFPEIINKIKNII